MKIPRSVKLAASVGAAIFLFITASSLFAQGRVPPSSQARPHSIAPNDTPTPEEQSLFDATNRERAAKGVAALKWDFALAAAAARHAARMAQEHTISHQFPGEQELLDRVSKAGAHFSAVAENVAEGPNPDSIHSGWMHSAGHRANILDPNLTAIGIGVVVRGGQLYAVQDFAHASEDLALGDQEKKVASLLAAIGLKAGNRSAEARQDCSPGHENDYPKDGSMFVFRWDTSDFSKLPDSFEEVIHDRNAKVASVGACRLAPDRGFARFRFAILLS
jgi:uncharacterized protein YkwD